MKIDTFLRKWYNNIFENYGGVTSPEYEEFQKGYKKVLTELANEIDFILYQFNKNHYEFSAVLQDTKTNKFYYISISDVRYWKNEWADRILYRTMEHDHDWHGGLNHYSDLKNLKTNLLKLK